MQLAKRELRLVRVDAAKRQSCMNHDIVAGNGIGNTGHLTLPPHALKLHNRAPEDLVPDRPLNHSPGYSQTHFRSPLFLAGSLSGPFPAFLAFGQAERFHVNFLELFVDIRKLINEFGENRWLFRRGVPGCGFA